MARRVPGSRRTGRGGRTRRVRVPALRPACPAGSRACPAASASAWPAPSAVSRAVRRGRRLARRRRLRRGRPLRRTSGLTRQGSPASPGPAPGGIARISWIRTSVRSTAAWMASEARSGTQGDERLQDRDVATQLSGKVLAPIEIVAGATQRSVGLRPVGLQRRGDGGAVAGLGGRGRFAEPRVESRQLRRGAGVGVGGQRLLLDPEAGGVEGAARTTPGERGADREDAHEEQGRCDGGRHPESAEHKARTVRGGDRAGRRAGVRAGRPRGSPPTRAALDAARASAITRARERARASGSARRRASA